MFGFPESIRPKSKQFRRNFLASVVFQIKYSLVEIDENDKKFFINEFKSDFPDVNDIKTGQVLLKFDKTPVFQSHSSQTDGFEAKSNDKNRVITFATDAITLSIHKEEYKNFDTEWKNFEKYISKFVKNKNIKTVSRVAIRKINTIGFIRDESESLADVARLLVSKGLQDSFLHNPTNDYFIHSTKQLICVDDGYKLHFNYGVQEAEKKLNGRIILDYDLFYVSENIEFKNVKNIFQKINNEIYSMFMYSVSSKFFEAIEDHENK